MVGSERWRVRPRNRSSTGGVSEVPRSGFSGAGGLESQEHLGRADGNAHVSSDRASNKQGNEVTSAPEPESKVCNVRLTSPEATPALETTVEQCSTANSAILFFALLCICSRARARHSPRDMTDSSHLVLCSLPSSSLHRTRARGLDTGLQTAEGLASTGT